MRSSTPRPLWALLLTTSLAWWTGCPVVVVSGASEGEDAGGGNTTDAQMGPVSAGAEPLISVAGFNLWRTTASAPEVMMNRKLKIMVVARNTGETILADGYLSITAHLPSGKTTNRKTGEVHLEMGTEGLLTQEWGPFEEAGWWIFRAELLDASGEPLANGPASEVRVKVLEPRPISMCSDNITNQSADRARMQRIVDLLQAQGASAGIHGIGPNTHITILDSSPADALIVEVYGGSCAGTLYEKGNSWYRSKLGARKDFLVFCCGAKRISGLDWLPRAHDDNFSPSSFKGLAHPDEFLRSVGVDFIESDDPQQIADAIYKSAAR